MLAMPVEPPTGAESLERVPTVCGGGPLTRILGIGDPVTDVMVAVEDEFLREIGVEKGGSSHAKHEDVVQILEKAKGAVVVPGGSTANVLKGLANLGLGVFQCYFVGMVGNDEVGKVYEDNLIEQHVVPCLARCSKGTPSAKSVCMVTGDGQRTMRTFLGAACNMEKDHWPTDVMSNGLTLLHVEGYCLYRPELALQSMRDARKAGATISMDLASFEVVRNKREELMQILKEELVDIMFCNEEEAAALVEGQEPCIEKAQDLVLQHCQVSVVSLGAKGCIARHRDGECVKAPALPVKVRDTVGAGDIFSSGFLFAYLQGYGLEKAARCGCAAGSAAVQVVGAQLPLEDWRNLREQIYNILGT